MAALTLTSETYIDKVFGAWQGKSVGITLGQPLRGQMVPGRFNYYSPVPGQPAASIALDFALVWLQTLEDTGPEVMPEDLAVAWLEHLDYSQDEFGYAALNLRRGLPPPASGAHSNWFSNGTGGIMRADFWAMIAPGNPQRAAAYAYHDAKLDHSEEGLWAAMFLAALGSAAFFLTDPLTLLTIGLAMIPRTCRTARAIKTALAVSQRGGAWLEARESVQHEVGHPNFTDVPQNMGFFTIGLLYGLKDFGSSLCAATNCGYDAEVIGGALGAVLGIQWGKSGLPTNWTGPLGDLVIPGYGLRDFDTPLTITEVTARTVALGKRVVEARCPEVAIVEAEAAGMEEAPAAAAPELEPPAPAPEPVAPTGLHGLSLEALGGEDLTPAPVEPPAYEFTTSAGETAAEQQPEPQETTQTTEPPVLTDAPPPVGFAPQAVSREEPAPLETVADASVPPALALAPDPASSIAWADSTLVKPLLVTPPNAFFAMADHFEVMMDAGDHPAMVYNVSKVLAFTITNRGDQPFSGRLSMLAPPGWLVSSPPNLGQRQYIAAHTGVLRIEFTLRANEGQARIDIANNLVLQLTPDGGGAPMEAEFLLLGASCWWTVGAFANFDGEGFDRSYTPEDRPGLGESYISRNLQSIRWEKTSFPESALPLEAFFKGSSGVYYGQTILRSPTTREARIVANTNSGVKVWYNGQLILRRFHRETFRPVLGSGPWAVDVTLRAGDNPIMVKWVRSTEPFEFSLTVSDRNGRGLPEVGNTTW
ncbi:MAG TPA: ADP-ribosylglycohydrolase family protein [Chthonomonadaceae bacterium]|nr:ADP-ribosylglycohydrolase family protein [Chthonomonadaceae bacterium]